MKLIKSILLIALFIFLTLPAQAVEYGGVGGRPANPRADNPRTESIFIYTAGIGETITDGVRVVNNTSETKTLLVYAVDSESSTGGSFACAQAVDAKKNVGAWIQLTKTEVTLDSMTNEVVPFSLLIPQNAGVGEHNGCIVIQEKKVLDPQSGNGVQLSFRTGLRVAVLIPGDIERKLEITDYQVVKKNKDIYFLQPKVSNLGNVSIDSNVRTITKYFFGKVLQTNGGGYPILRGETSEWNFELKHPFWGGWYKTKVEVEYDANINAEIGKNNGQALIKLSSPTVWFFVWPTPIALAIEIGVLILIALAIFLIIRRRK